jgi:hypothetical protein
MRHLAAVLTLAALAVPASALAATDKTPPKIKLTGLPAAGSCAATAKVKLKVTDASGVRRIYVFLDGNQVGSHTPGSGALKLAFPAKLKVGRHRLGVSASDNAGNVRTKVVHFTLCRKS